MQDKIITIIIPMYNSRNYIAKCLESLIIRKGMERVEILVINDGSTDGCEKLVDFYLKNYPDVFRLVNKKNGGHGSVINEGVKLSRGKYIKVLDADDWFHTIAFEKTVHFLADIDSDIVLNGYEIYNISDGQSERIYGPQSVLSDEFNMTEVLKRWAQYKQLFSIHGIIYNTAFYRSISAKLPENVFYDDAFYFIHFASRAKSIRLINKLLYVYRVGDVNQSVSRQNRVARIRQHEMVIREICRKDKVDLSQEGREYWYRKTVSVCADYLITAFLRFDDRQEGRIIAKHFIKRIRQCDRELYRRFCKKYFLLKVISFLGISEAALQKIMRKRK